ncbi:MAG: NADPH-dependent FMN reductase [Cyanobacteria bacterium PR.023]|nr:NADPH-dependent FMN reductase [Cyanobacteria bacterium PR.023]
MANKAKILCFAGSLRADSVNKKLVKIAMQGAKAAGAEVTYIDLKDYPMPIYDEDIETTSGLPENAVKLKELFLAHNGLLMATPEYNSSVSAVWKNTIDWVSRSANGEPMLHCYTGKVAAIMSASPGQLGGLRGLTHVRSILENIQVMVLPDQFALPMAYSAFAVDETKLVDEKKNETVIKIGEKLAHVTAKLLA